MRLLPLVALFSVLALSARAEIVLDLVFDDPAGLIKTKPEGISQFGHEVAGGAATLASGTGGRAVVQAVEGPPAERRPGEARLQVLTEPTMGTSAFIRSWLTQNSVTRNIGLGVAPNDIASSLSGFVTYKEGRALIDGAFDFFVRFNAEGMSQPKFGIWGKAGALGFNLNIVPTEQKAALKIFTSKKSLDADGTGTPQKAGIEVRSETQVFFETDAIYHVAVSWQTNPEGLITMTVSMQQGTGPMNAEETTVAAIRNFAIIGEEDRAMPDKITLNLGRSAQIQTMDLAAFRIFRPAPTVFPGIDGKE